MYSHTSVTIRPNAAYHSMYFGAPWLDARFDEVEVEHQVQRGDHDDEQAEADADQAGFVDVRHVVPNRPQHDRDQVDQRDAAGGRDHAELEVLRRPDQPAAVRHQQREQRADVSITACITMPG